MDLFSRKPSMKCSKCGFPVLPKHTFCPHCGQPLTEDAEQQVAQEQHEKKESLREQWETEFDLERKKQQVSSEAKKNELDDEAEREKLIAEHKQELAEREALRGREGQQFDFDLEERRKEADEARGVTRDIHLQEMADRETARSQDAADREAQRSREGQQFDFDLEERRKEADEARGVTRDIHLQEMADRETAREQDAADREAQRSREGQQFDFDLEVQRQERADEHVLRMEEHEMKRASHEQDMADREAQRRMEELKMKGSIAMQNMQAMMEAKRAARQDELRHEEEMQQSQLDAEERRLQTQKDMTAEQIMAAQIREMDAGAQTAFAESFSAGKDAAREREVAKEQAQIYERMMGQMMDMAKAGMQVNAEIASGRIAEERSRADEYREEAHRSQERLDHTQDQSLRYTAQVTTAAPTPQQEPVEEAIPLNTAWLREHGFSGSFNELAQQLAKLGANISQDRDADGNPVIVVRKLSSEQVYNILVNNGVQF